jgi:hypothetical protein
VGVREKLLLTGPRRIVAARTPERHAEVRRWWAAARARLRVAERLDPKREQLAAVPIYRDGVLALAGVALAATEGSVKPEDVASLDAAWASLERAWPKLGIATPLSEFGPARAALAEPVAVDAGPRPIADALASLDRLARLVERAIEPRPLRWLTWRARTQVAVLAIAIVGALAIEIPPLFRPPNVALGKPVKSSSTHPESLAPTDGTWLDNGRIERLYGVATNNEQNPWMQIDLQKPTLIKRIVVYNRGDGWFNECLPLEISVGDDETKLHRIGLRETLFTQFFPWTLETNETARFVRLTKRGSGAYALSEVEVYSR